MTGSRRRKLRLCNAVGIAVGAGRRGTGRLSNYPLKPNLRCCLKLTYANETAKSRRRRRLDGSQIGFRVLSRRHRRRKSERYTDVALRYITCWCDVFHLGLNASGEKKKKLQIAWSKAGGIKQGWALMSAQRMILLERFHGSNIILKTTKFFLVFRA